jgi:hypothetical protein
LAKRLERSGSEASKRTSERGNVIHKVMGHYREKFVKVDKRRILRLTIFLAKRRNLIFREAKKR